MSEVSYLILCCCCTDQYCGCGAVGESGLLQWLTSPELLHTLTSSTTELLETLQHVQDKDKSKAVIHIDSFNLLQLVSSACVGVVKCCPILHYGVVIFFSGPVGS